MKSLIAAGLFSVISFSAFATGGFYCAVENSDVVLEISATTPRGFGAQLIEPTAIKLVQKSNSIPSELRSVDFELKNIAQYWNEGDELRLLAYKENDSLNYYNDVQVLLKTKWSKKEGKYVGTYKVTLNANLTDKPVNKVLSGKIACDAE